MPRYQLTRLARLADHASVVFAKHGVYREPIQFLMDIDGCNTRLDLDALEAADEVNLIHDLAGIMRYLDRETGELRECFRPRYAISEA